MTELGTAGRLLRGELRRPDPLLLAMLLAVVVGVAALTSVSGFAQRVQAAIDARAATLLGGSVRITAQRDLRPVAASLPSALRPATTVLELPTMAAAGERLRLVELKAVDAAYPLLGELLIAGQGRSARRRPARCGWSRCCWRSWASRWVVGSNLATARLRWRASSRANRTAWPAPSASVRGC